ncbi:MAG: glycosyltransferase family 4 protein [Clostridia bacterium]|nr:glycosyltransferase family 4 protein [Clostridia bacterium]
MRKINVLHVLATDKFSGSEKVAGLICQYLNKEKFNALIACNGGLLLDKYKREGLNALHFNVNRLGLSNIRRFNRLIRENQVDIVHAHGARASMFAWALKKLSLRKFKVISHVHECSEYLKSKNKMRMLDQWLRNRFDYNLLCGKKVLEHYKTYAGYLDTSKAHVLSNAIEAADFDEADSQEAKQRYQLGDAFIYGFVGRFSKPKGLIPFLLKLAENKDVLEGSKLVLVGDGEDAGELQRIVESCRLSDRVVFTGSQDQVFKFLHVFDLFILPSITEGLPMVILEAMAAGRPVLSFNVGSIAEVVRDGVNGYLIEPQDYPAFFRKMRELKTKKEELHRLGENGRDIAVSEFSMKGYMEKIEKLYFEAVSLGGQGK